MTTFGADLPTISDEDWAKTPASARHLVGVLIQRISLLEKKVADLEERLRQNSSNSSKPPILRSTERSPAQAQQTQQEQARSAEGAQVSPAP